MNDQLTFVVTEFPTGTRAWFPLPGSEADLATLLAEGDWWVEVRRTGDPEELEEMMGGGEGGSDAQPL